MAEIGRIEIKVQQRKQVHIFQDERIEWDIPEYALKNISDVNSKFYESLNFNVAGVLLFLRMSVTSTGLQFELKSNHVIENSLYYNFELKVADSKVLQLQEGVISGIDKGNDTKVTVPFETLQQRALSSLTLICILQTEPIHSFETTELENPTDFNFLSK